MTDRVTYVGHATLLLEHDGAVFLTDPLLRSRVAHLRRRHAVPPAPPRLDGILLSHAHLDHLDLPSLRQLDRDVPVVVPEGLERLLRRQGFTAVEEVAVGEQVMLAGVPVRAVPAAHGVGRRPGATPAAALGFVIGERWYFAGDTDLFPGMADLADALELALLPVWGWGAKIGPGHLDPLRAAEALTLLRPRIAVPIHWGTLFPLVGNPGDRLHEPPREFARHAATLAPDVIVRVLEPGQALTPEDVR